MKSILVGVLIATASSATALAQQSSGAPEYTTITSEPGSAFVVHTKQISAGVVKIDKGTRTVTLKTPDGDTMDVVASDAVKNFDQIKVGDVVTAQYASALALQDSKGPAGEPKETEGATTAPPGARPAFIGGRQLTSAAEVVAVDPKERTITLKGKDGKTVTLDVRNPDQFKVVKKGDQIEVTYTEAVAVAVEPVSKPAPEKNE